MSIERIEKSVKSLLKKSWFYRVLSYDVKYRRILWRGLR